MAFGITRQHVNEWKRKIDRGEIAFLTHYWYDERFPKAKTVTKVGCKDINKLIHWGEQYGLKREWIHHRKEGYSHFDLLGEVEKRILKQEGLWESSRFFFIMIRNMELHTV
ncbi:hypothetical protein [Caldifermentibacillus hisashii]|uniref:hypothetical protein n=1 Tax=Caldifermentibacillus hisashii TaxID=996558 RepID=UPI003101B002